MNSAQSAKASASQRSRTKSSSTRPFGDDDMRQRVEHRDVGAGRSGR